MDAIVAAVPFVGLRPFDVGDQRWFFGREQECADLARKVRSNGLTAVIGASGSGKSSLVRAGLLPGLVADGWRPVITKPGSAPLARLAGALAASAAQHHEQDWLADTRRYRFDAALRSSAYGLAEVAGMVAGGERLILVVDQFEELFRFGEEATGATRAAMLEEGCAFVELLLTAARQSAGQLNVVLTMRSDFFGACSAYPGLAEAVSSAQYLVPLPQRDQLEVAIRRPIEQANAVIDDALVQRLLVDVEEEQDRLPLLQHTLRCLWDCASGEPRRVNEKSYVAVGRLAGSIDGKAEQVRTELVTAHPEDAIALERVMKALSHLDENERATRRAQTRSQLLAILPGRDADPSLTRVVGALATEHTSFLQLGEGDDPEIDIGHEALIRYWKRLAGGKLDFRAGWLRDERNDGERWRGYVRRAEEGPLLGVQERVDCETWLRGGRFNPAWSARYGDHWAEVEELQRRSKKRHYLVVGVFLFLGLVLACGAFWLWEIGASARREALRSTRLGTLALSQMTRQLAAQGDARTATLLIREALPADSGPGQERYMPEAASALADALAHDREVWRALAPTSVSAVAFAPDGRRVASAGSSDSTVRMWDAVTGQPIGGGLRGHDRPVTAVAFSPDGQRIASGSQDNTVRVWDAATGQPIGAPMRHEGAVNAVAFSPDGRRIVSGSDDKTLRLWAAATGAPIGAPLSGHDGPVNAVAFSLDGRRIVSGSADKTIRLWDGVTGETSGAPLQARDGPVTAVALSPDGLRIVSGSIWSNALTLWDAISGQPIAALPGHSHSIKAVAFSPDGRRIASGSFDNTLRLWDAATGQPIGAGLQGHGDAVSAVAFSPDGRRVLSGSYDKTLRLWDAAAGQAVRAGPREQNALPQLPGPLGNAVAFSPDAQRIVAGGPGNALQVVDAATGQPIGSPLQGHRSMVSAVAFSPDGRRIASGSSDSTVRVWDAASGQPIGAPLQGHEDTISAVAFSPDGRRIVSGSYDNTLRLWDTATLQPIGAALVGHEGAVSAVAFSPDGRRLVSGSWDKTLRFWDAATGEPGEPLRRHSNWVAAVAFSADGRRVVSGSWDNTLRLWDAETGQPIGAPLQGHTDRVTAVAFSPDGRRIVSGSSDRTLRLWDTSTGQPIGAPLRGHNFAMTAVAFSPDASRILSMSWDGMLLFWDPAPFSRPLAELTSLADGLCPLSRDERAAAHLLDPQYPVIEHDWTPAQKHACGIWE